MRVLIVAGMVGLSSATQALAETLRNHGVEVVVQPLQPEQRARQGTELLVESLRPTPYASFRKTKGEKKREASARRRKGWC